MAGRLDGFLARSLAKPFVWGSFDCILFLADWSIERLGTDPADAYRGRYRTPLGAQRIIRKAGGLVALIEREFRPCGWGQSDDLGPGDIGVVEVETPSGKQPAGAIFTGSHWCVLGQHGLIATACHPLASWRPACLKP